MKQQLQALLRLVAIIRKVLVSRTSTIDNAKAAELELAHLLEPGHRDIAAIKGSIGNGAAEDRWATDH